MKSKVTRFYYDLAELANMTGPAVVTGATTIPALIQRMYNGLTAGTTTTEDATLFSDYFWPVYYEVPVLYIDTECAPWEEPTEPTAAEVTAAVAPLAGRMYAWYKESSARYLKLIALYTNVANKLMDQVSSTTSGNTLRAESDTPQSAMTDIFDTGYASRASQDESEVTVSSDVSTPIDRLREVQEKLRNFYADWAGEFDKFVLHEAE